MTRFNVIIVCVAAMLMVATAAVSLQSMGITSIGFALTYEHRYKDEKGHVWTQHHSRYINTDGFQFTISPPYSDDMDIVTGEYVDGP